jgi:hypothetical protein
MRASYMRKRDITAGLREPPISSGAIMGTVGVGCVGDDGGQLQSNHLQHSTVSGPDAL